MTAQTFFITKRSLRSAHPTPCQLADRFQLEPRAMRTSERGRAAVRGRHRTVSPGTFRARIAARAAAGSSLQLVRLKK